DRCRRECDRAVSLGETRVQEPRYLSLRKVCIPSLDDKLKLVGHCGVFDMLQLVGEVVRSDFQRTQDPRYLSLHKVSIPSLDDKLKLVGHCKPGKSRTVTKVGRFSMELLLQGIARRLSNEGV